jgi:hypothetical protein
MKRKLACKESISDIWGYPYGPIKVPSTARLFTAIAAESFACLFHTDWDVRIKRIENCLSVIKSRMRLHWESWHEDQLNKLIIKAKGDRDVGRND